MRYASIYQCWKQSRPDTGTTGVLTVRSPSEALQSLSVPHAYKCATYQCYDPIIFVRYCFMCRSLADKTVTDLTQLGFLFRIFFAGVSGMQLSSVLQPLPLVPACLLILAPV